MKMRMATLLCACGATLAFVPPTVDRISLKGWPVSYKRHAVSSPSVTEASEQISKELQELADIMKSLRGMKQLNVADLQVSVPKQVVEKEYVSTPTKAGVGLRKQRPKKTAIVCESYQPPTDEFIQEASLNFLEEAPYWDNSAVPINTFKPNAPYKGTITAVQRLTSGNAPGEVCHVTIDHGGMLPYWEGQSLCVIPPGVDANGKPHKVRLYSIASTRYGDSGDGKTVTLCVRRAEYVDPETGIKDPAKAGVCSAFLCGAGPGTAVSIAGPSGKIMLLPEEDPSVDIIMVGTGTGVAPYRGFVRRLFQEDTFAARAYTGLAWLFLGVANQDSLLYHEDWLKVCRRFPFNFRYNTALSREEKNSKGGKMYIQDKMEEHADEIFDRLDKGAHIYFCGLKGMMPGITQMLQRVAESKNMSWETKLAELKKKGQWHVEVY